MPELPEVETMRRGILDCVGDKVRDFVAIPCERKPIAITPSISRFRRKVIGQEIVAVERLGKRVIVRLEDQSRIVFEPRMTGLVLTTSPPSEEHLRARLDVSGELEQIWYWDRRAWDRSDFFQPPSLKSERTSLDLMRCPLR